MRESTQPQYASHQNSPAHSPSLCMNLSIAIQFAFGNACLITVQSLDHTRPRSHKLKCRSRHQVLNACVWSNVWCVALYRSIECGTARLAMGKSRDEEGEAGMRVRMKRDERCVACFSVVPVSARPSMSLLGGTHRRGGTEEQMDTQTTTTMGRGGTGREETGKINNINRGSNMRRGEDGKA